MVEHTFIRSRTSARIAAVQALYEMDLRDAPALLVLKEFIDERWPHPSQGDTNSATAKNNGFQIPNLDQKLLQDIVIGVSEEKSELDKKISGALSTKWTIDRLEVLIRATLRAGVYEIINNLDVPVPVALNEYMSVSHVFFSGSEPKLINGVMDKLANELRPDFALNSNQTSE